MKRTLIYTADRNSELSLEDLQQLIDDSKSLGIWRGHHPVVEVIPARSSALRGTIRKITVEAR